MFPQAHVQPGVGTQLGLPKRSDAGACPSGSLALQGVHGISGEQGPPGASLSSHAPDPTTTYTAPNPAGGHWHSKGLAPQHHYGHPMRVGSGAARRQPLFLLIQSHLCVNRVVCGCVPCQVAVDTGTNTHTRQSYPRGILNCI